MRPIQVQQVMRIDEQVAQILHFGLVLLGRDREYADKLEEVQKEGLADFEEVVGVV